MVSYTSYFAVGQSETIILTDLSIEMRAEIEQSYKDEYNLYQRESRQNKQRLEDGLQSQKSETNTSDPVFSEILRQDRIARVRAAIAQLLPEQQELIILIQFQEVKAPDIAKRDNVSPSAISKRLERAEQKLKKLLA